MSENEKIVILNNDEDETENKEQKKKQGHMVCDGDMCRIVYDE